jgi:protocatechuate 3,4-dioxygenase beta subunit
MFVEGRVMDTKGNPIAGAVIDTWETDGLGKYDTQVMVLPLIIVFCIDQVNAV